jgi:hypothetical protein
LKRKTNYFNSHELYFCKVEEAAEAYNRAAQCFIEIDSKFEAATHFVNASNCLKKSKVSGSFSFFVWTVNT